MRTPAGVDRSVQADDRGGATLSTKEGEVILVDSWIRRLYILKCPRIRVGKLRGCPRGVHVTIEGARALGTSVRNAPTSTKRPWWTRALLTAPQRCYGRRHDPFAHVAAGLGGAGQGG